MKTNKWKFSYSKSQQGALFLNFTLVKSSSPQTKLRNSASFGLLLQEYVTMHGPLNVRKVEIY